MANAPLRARPKRRLGRAALMSFGLSVGAAGIAGTLDGCDDDDDRQQDIYGGPPQPKDAGDHEEVDARTPIKDAAIDAATKPDAGSDASTTDARVVDASATGVDAAVDSGIPHVVPLYGAPAPRN